MVYTGMIFQFNDAQGSGLIMLSDGETKAFSLNEWVDSLNEPKVGLKISYEVVDNVIKIKVPNESEENDASSTKKTIQEDIASLTSVQEHVKYFEEMGYRLVKKPNTSESDNVTMRRYSMDQHEEITISGSDSKASVTKTINGQKSSF